MKLHSFFDFCSGIGGGRIGLERCGLSSVGYADTSRLSVKTYCSFFDERLESNFGNIKKIKICNLPEFDLLIAGFPCQSFSVIGNMKGFDDPRGQIIFDIADIIYEKKPKAFILENVKGLKTHDNGKTFEVIVKLLISKGYHVFYNVLNSLEFGVPQMRQRVYLVGVREDFYKQSIEFQWPSKLDRPKLENFLIDSNNSISDENYERLIRYLNNDVNKGKYSVDDFLLEDYLVIDTRMSDLRLYRERVPALRSHRDGIFYVKNKVIKELTGYEALLLQGFPKKITDTVKDKVSNRHLLKQAGNAMTVNVIELIGLSLLKYFSDFEKHDKKNE